MERIKRSIPIKISLTILVIEVVLLAAMGIFYIDRFSEEIDERIIEKLTLPGVLMSQRALPYDSVKDLRALSDLVQERVVEAFIFRKGGDIFFTGDPAKEGKTFIDFLDKQELLFYQGEANYPRHIAFSVEGGNYHSFLIPLYNQGEHLGGLYIRISEDAVAEKKQRVVWFFCLGALLAIVLTTLFEAFVVHRLFVPRIAHAAAALKQYEGGDFSCRITDVGANDQLGELMRLANSLLETIAQYTAKLHALNVAGEAFARADNQEEIFRIAISTTEQALPVRPATSDDNGELFVLPVRDIEVQGGQKLRFVGISDEVQFAGAETSFVQALSGLMESGLRRIEDFNAVAQAEGKYRDLFESALEGIFRTDRAGVLQDVNPAMAIMSGFESAAEMLDGKVNVSELYADRDGQERLLDLLGRNDTIRDYELNLKRRDGSVYPASINIRAIRNQQGEIESTESRVVDISERKLQEEKKQKRLAAEAVTEARLLLVEDLEYKNRQLQEALDELRNTQLQLIQSEKMAAVGMTAGGVAHDLNNILTGVVSYPELLLATLPADSQLRKPLQAILASGKRAVAVVADLLTLARGIARTKQRTALEDLVEEYLHSVEFRQMMRDYPDVAVNWQGAGEKTYIDCSPTHILKVIMNLVMNAVEAAPQSSGIVDLQSWRSIEGVDGAGEVGEFAVLDVRDNGPGVPPESRKHIFEPFYTRKIMGKKGTGLGLTVVWNVVREHEGKVELHGDGPGTTFRVTLPAVASPVADGKALVEEVDLRGKGFILVVDDEPLQRDVAHKILTTFGYEVATVASGEEAVAFIRGAAVDLVLLDMLMPPGINGLETYRRILAERPGQKALIVSGFSESSDVKTAMDLGVGGFVKKPFTMAQIALAVKNELARGRSATGRPVG